jgi:hypothetical protein
MLTAFRERALVGANLAVLSLVVAMALCRDASADDDPSRASSAARLKFLQQQLRDMKVDSTVEDDPRELKFQMTPLLRYNDPPRGIADSVIFRLGTRGRPIALVTAELYGGTGRQYALSHEFLAIDNPRVTVQRDVFRWQPPKEAGVTFKPLATDQRPSETARARLAQFKELAGRFTAREEWRGVQMELRVLPTPIDRYVPSDKPNADAAIFAFVQGVNPEAVLLLETDGKEWSYAWARLAAAQVRAKLGDELVWDVPQGAVGEDSSAGYTYLNRGAEIPVELETENLDARPDKD